jgi:hypothetical protein
VRGTASTLPAEVESAFPDGRKPLPERQASLSSALIAPFTFSEQRERWARHQLGAALPRSPREVNAVSVLYRGTRTDLDARRGWRREDHLYRRP